MGRMPSFALHGSERSVDLRQLYVTLPKHCRILYDHVGAQQIMPVAQLGLLQLLFVDWKVKGFPRALLAV